MAIPVIADQSAGLAGGASGSQSPGWMTGIPAGDLLVVIGWLISSSGGVINTPAGWTKVAGKVTSGPLPNEISLFYKVAAGGDTAPTFSVSTGYSMLTLVALRITGAADPALSPPLLHFAAGSAGATATVNFATTDSSTYVGPLDLAAIGVSGGNVSFTWSNPNGVMNNITSKVDGGVVSGDSVSLAYGDSPSDGNGSYFASPIRTTFSAARAYYYAWFAIPAGQEKATLAGSLKRVSGSAAISIKKGVAVAGSLKRVSGSSAVLILNGSDATIAGALGHVSGSSAVEIDDAVALIGRVASIVGSGEIVVPLYLGLAGALPGIAGAADIVIGPTAQISGVLAHVGGHAAISVTTKLQVAGLLPRIVGRLKVRDPRIGFPTDPDVIITMPDVDRVIAMPAVSRGMQIAASDRQIIMPAVDRMAKVGE